MAERNIDSKVAAAINSMVAAAINSLVEAAPLISSMAAAVINRKNSAAAVSRNTPAAATMVATSATSSTAEAAINTHITAAGIMTVFLKRTIRHPPSHCDHHTQKTPSRYCGFFSKLRQLSDAGRDLSRLVLRNSWFNATLRPGFFIRECS